MKKELESKLFTSYPNLYTDKLAYGFQFDDGWYQLINNLSCSLEQEISVLSELDRKKFKAVQVKEKFGILRFYLSGYTAAMQYLIAQAEFDSHYICEKCGEFGELRGKYWYYVACDEHTKQADK